MKYVCNNCNKEFNIDKFNRRYLVAMITKDYFTCSHCNKEYTLSVDNVKTRRLKREINEVVKEIGFFNSLGVFNYKDVVKELQDKHMELMLECQIELKRLGNKFK